MSRRNRTITLLATASAWLLSVLILVPLLIVILAALKTKPEAAAMDLALPTAIQWGNFAQAIQRGGLVRAFLNSMLITAGLGIVFLIGVVGFEWQGHIKPSDGVYGAVLFGMTGLHALHVLSGVVLILLVWNLGRKGRFSAERHWGVEATAIYWHFVDVVWVLYYPALYLMGTAAH